MTNAAVFAIILIVIFGGVRIIHLLTRQGMWDLGSERDPWLALATAVVIALGILAWIRIGR